MPNPVVHFDVTGRDMDALAKFYTEAFGWTLQPVMDGYSLAMTGNKAGIDGGIGVAGDVQMTTFYVEVEDLQKILDKAEKLGGKTTMPVSEVVPGQVTLAMFSDPEGHPIGLVLAQGEAPPREDTGGKYAVTWFEVTGKDGKKLQKFYGDLFGWKIKADNEMGYGEVDTGTGRGIGGGIATADAPDHAWVTFYVQCDDVKKTLGMIESHGGKALFGPMELPDHSMEFGGFADPDGSMIGLYATKK